MRSIRRLFVIVALVLMVGGTVPVQADCDYFCLQSYDFAQCWRVGSGNGDMSDCYPVCDCMGWSCACWCTGRGCYWA